MHIYLVSIHDTRTEAHYGTEPNRFVVRAKSKEQAEEYARSAHNLPDSEQCPWPLMGKIAEFGDFSHTTAVITKVDVLELSDAPGTLAQTGVVF